MDKLLCCGREARRVRSGPCRTTYDGHGKPHPFKNKRGKDRYHVDGMVRKDGSPIRYRSLEAAEKDIRNKGLVK